MMMVFLGAFKLGGVYSAMKNEKKGQEVDFSDLCITRG